MAGIKHEIEVSSIDPKDLSKLKVICQEFIKLDRNDDVYTVRHSNLVKSTCPICLQIESIYLDW